MASQRTEEGLGPPESWGRFRAAMRRVLAVTKEESDAQIKAAQAERQQKRDKKKGSQ